MINYEISCKNPSSQFIQLRLTFSLNEAKVQKLQLPAWRAGRYQLANYAQFIRGFKIMDEHSNPVPFEKIASNRWVVYCDHPGEYLIDYEFWAGKMDAGSAWVDDEQVYLNLVNCCFEILDYPEEEIHLSLDLPDFPQQISTLIPISDSVWKATDFQMLADSTVLATNSLNCWSYFVGKAAFKIWIKGEVHFDRDLLIRQFEAFSEKLIQDFGEFPEPEYQFIFQLLPYVHYHGVEHRRGTVITFGPAESLADPEQMEELLGISCHELYHAWNVCRIRPKELLPYDFSKETYTKAGLLLEGVTTYMGDLYLLKSGVYDLPTYLKHLEKVLARESAGFGWRNYTIAESSFDLWLDGYVPGVPDRKVSIYTRGALLSLCLDVLLLKSGSSLSRVMREMWELYGKSLKGYEMGDFARLIHEKFEDKAEIEAFFSDFIHGKKDLFPLLKTQLASLGIELKETETENWLLHRFGIRASEDQVITQIHPYCKAYSFLMKNDQILKLDFDKNSNCAEIALSRQGRVLKYELEEQGGAYFPVHRLSSLEVNSLTKKWRT